LSEEEWPKERRLRVSRDIGWRYCSDIVRGMINEIGVEGATKIMREVLLPLAEKHVPKERQRFKITGNDPWSVACHLNISSGGVMGFNTEIVRESDKKAIYRIYPNQGRKGCLMDPDRTLPPELCRSLLLYEVAAAEITNPKIKATVTQVITEGAPCCEVIFEEVDQ
jgi:hypothetical protein